MKNVLATLTLLIVCGTTSLVKGQTNVKTAQQVNFKENLFAFNFIEDIFFNPEAGILMNTSSVSSATYKASSVPSSRMPGPKPEKISESEAPIEFAEPVQFKYAMMLDVNIEALTLAGLYNFIDEWMGTRYRMGGTTKRGIDCSAFTSGLLLAVYSLSVPRTARDQYHFTERIEKEDLAEGDLVFFNTRGGVSHVGIYLANGRFVHSSSSQGVTISSLDDSYYSKRFISGGRAG